MSPDPLGVLFLDMALQKAPWINYGWLEGFIPTFDRLLEPALRRRAGAGRAWARVLQYAV